MELEYLITVVVIAGGVAGLLLRIGVSLATLSRASVLGLVAVLFLGSTYGLQRYIWADIDPGDPTWDGPVWLLSWVYALGMGGAALIVFLGTYALAGLLLKK